MWKEKKFLCAAVVTALTVGSTTAYAADYGIGVSVQSDDSILYAPIDFNDKFRLEPNIRYAKSEFETSLGTASEQERLEVGVGLFALGTVSKSVRVYYGGRVSYIDQENTQSSVFISAALGNLVPAATATTTADSDGYRISPTIGFEFLFNERLSIGGEAEYFFEDIDGDGNEAKNSGTDTRLILRFKF
jgi:hypothetical protein